MATRRVRGPTCSSARRGSRSPHPNSQAKPPPCARSNQERSWAMPSPSVRHGMPPPTYQSDPGCLPTGLRSAAEGVSHLGRTSGRGESSGIRSNRNRSSSTSSSPTRTHREPVSVAPRCAATRAEASTRSGRSVRAGQPRRGRSSRRAPGRGCWMMARTIPVPAAARAR